MTRSSLLLPVVAGCLSLTSCFGCVLGGGGGQCEWAGDDSPKAPKGSTITVHGTVARADGTAMTGTVLMRDPATGNDILGAILTLGLSCLKGDLTVDCEEWRKLSLDAQGGYGLTYPEEDTHGMLFDKTFDFFAAAPAQPSGLDGPAMAFGAGFWTEKVEVPAMKLWEPEVSLSARDGKVEVAASPLPESTACASVDSLEVVFAAADGTETWAAPLGPVDERVLEGFDGAVFVRQRTNYYPGSALSYGLFTSAKAAFKSSSGPAPSRGAACTASGDTWAAGACPFTDGKWAETYLSGGWALVDLGASESLSLVALRGHFSAAQVLVSGDAKEWRTLKSEIAGRSVAFEAPAGTSARYLKVAEAYQLESQYQPALSLQEVSAWR